MKCRVWTDLLLHEVWDSLFPSPHTDQGAIADKAVTHNRCGRLFVEWTQVLSSWSLKSFDGNRLIQPSFKAP